VFSLMLKTLRRRNLVPAMSETERAALEAGDVWIEGELFSGRPDFRRMLAEPYPELTPEERAFLDGPVEEVCARTDREEVRRTRCLPPEVWALLRRHRFFGLGFPKRYGGHEFSALAQSTVYGKLATRSLALSSVVLIPNSVGPGELLLEVGTDEQRERYLPRLPGEIRTLDDAIIGHHHGLMFYTIGQREGLGIGGIKGSDGNPWYVAGKDPGRNILRVVQGVDHPALFNRRLRTGKLHWIAGSAPTLPLVCTARIRYRQADRPCLVTGAPEGSGIVEFREPQRAVTPGQSVVFYDGEDCLGGGVIEQAL